MLPPYFDDNTIDCKDSERTAFNNQKSATVKYFRGVNGGFTADFKSRNVHSMILDDYTAPSLQPQASIWQRLYKRFWSAFISTSSSPEPDILLTVSNRGSTFKLLHNPHHRDVLKNTYNFTEQTAFPCIFHFLFQMNDEVCNSDCQRVANRLRRADNDNTVTLAIHVRNPGAPTATCLLTSDCVTLLYFTLLCVIPLLYEYSSNLYVYFYFQYEKDNAPFRGRNGSIGALPLRGYAHLVPSAPWQESPSCSRDCKCRTATSCI